MPSTSNSSPGNAGLHQPHRLANALQAHRLLLVRDDQPPDARISRRDHPAEADLRAGERLQLQRDVLQDVREVSAFFQSLHEAAALTAGARVLVERRQQLDQPLAEPGNVDRADVFQRAQREIARDHGCESPEVGTSHRTEALDANLGGIHGGGRQSWSAATVDRGSTSCYGSCFLRDATGESAGSGR
jgi:hypothetical protein